jgi:hypothetical protein
LKRFLATSDCPKIAILQSFVEDGIKKGEALVGDTPKKDTDGKCLPSVSFFAVKCL